jgi:hypothetical protein
LDDDVPGASDDYIIFDVPGRDVPLVLHVEDAFQFLLAINAGGVDRAARLARAGVELAGGTVDAQTYHQITVALDTLRYRMANTASYEELIMRLAYYALREKQITREEAAEQASEHLGQQFRTEPFRKRLDRWAASRGLPAIGQTKRRSRKLSGQNST